jgi:ElaB/YqjD/DUF883 family membrane-anchored ribosome-binding protein
MPPAPGIPAGRRGQIPVRNPKGSTMRQENNVHAAKQQLIEDFSKVVSDSEGLLRAMASAPGEKAVQLRASAEASLSAAKERLRQLQGAAVEKTTAVARATDTYVHDNPWPLIGAAAFVGFVIGLALRDRD